MESYDQITRKSNSFLSVDEYDQYSLFDLTHCFNSKAIIKSVVIESNDYNMMLEIFYENLKLNNLGFEEYIENCVLEAILNTKEFEEKKKFNDCNLNDLNSKFMSFLEMLLLLYENVSSPNDFIKKNINNLDELYEYITNRNIFVAIDSTYFGNTRELKSIVFFDQRSLIDDLIKNQEYEELTSIVRSKIENMYFLVLNMSQLMGFIDYIDNVMINYRTFKILLRESEIHDINFVSVK